MEHDLTAWISTGVASLGGVAALKVAAARTVAYLRDRYRVVSVDEWANHQATVQRLRVERDAAISARADLEDRYAGLRLRAAELSVRYRALAGTLDDEYNPDIAED